MPILRNDKLPSGPSRILKNIYVTFRHFPGYLKVPSKIRAKFEFHQNMTTLTSQKQVKPGKNFDQMSPNFLLELLEAKYRFPGECRKVLDVFLQYSGRPTKPSL